MNRSSLSIIKDTAEKFPLLVRDMKRLAQNDTIRQFQLHRISAIGLMLWPAFWGFWAGGSPDWGRLPSLIILVIALRVLALLLTTPKQIDDEADQKPLNPLWLIIIGAIALWISILLGPVTIALTLVWSAGIALSPYANKVSWAPQILSSILYGVWPVMFGTAAAETVSLSLLFILPAAFLWALSVESVRSFGRKSLDLTYGIKPLSLLLGEKHVPVLALFLVSALGFLLAAGTVAAWNGLFYGFLMVAQGFWTVSWHCCQQDEENATRSSYKWLVVGGAFISLGLLFS
jgi:4-hydroxybenzoate polyprenyltransferase